MSSLNSSRGPAFRPFDPDGYAQLTALCAAGQPPSMGRSNAAASPNPSAGRRSGGLRRQAAGVALLLFSLAAAGCSAIGPQAGAGEVIFQDDFSRANSGWDRYQDPTYSSNYEEGAYRIHVLTAETFAWANPDLQLTDAHIEVDAAKIGGPDDNVFGVLCRYQDSHNFYFFLISSDGYYGIGVEKADRRQLLTDDSLLPSQAVLQGEQWNHIRADCEGFALRLYVNGQLLAETRAAEWRAGDVGLIAGTYGQPGAEVLFDNFSVVRPEQP